ncbi:MAG: DUF6168 family protein [Bacteroidota bacterium]
MKKLPLRFVLVLFSALLIAFLFHFYVLENLDFPPFADMLIPSYITNFLLAAVVFMGLWYARKKLKNALGFLFMGGSLIKFAVFFIVFYPTYKADGAIVATEFAAFFIPYLIALILETYFASKMLNQVGDS